MVRQYTTTALILGHEAADMSGRHHTSKEVMAGLSGIDSHGKQDNDGRCLPSLLRASSAVQRTVALVEEGGLAPYNSAKTFSNRPPI